MGLTRRTHNIVREHFDERDKGVAVDATCGNGFDTEFLAMLGFKKVISIDVQSEAIESTRKRLHDAKLGNVELILDGHETLKDHVSTHIDCAMFNFGYLPNSDSAIATKSSTSLVAVQACLSLLSEKGLVTLLCYPGFPQGAIETEALENYLSTLPASFKVETHLASVPKPTAPILFSIKGALAN